MLLQKLVHKREDNLSKSKSIAILGSALVGSLAFTFTDSFWFNAVETEVYAMATLNYVCFVLFRHCAGNKIWINLEEIDG